MLLLSILLVIYISIKYFQKDICHQIQTKLKIV
jgi:hypothetical protein